MFFRGLSKRYQAGEEFKARQLWLDFQDAVGPALEAITESVQKSRKWFKKWMREFVRSAEVRLSGWQQMEFGWITGLA